MLTVALRLDGADGVEDGEEAMIPRHPIQVHRRIRGRDTRDMRAGDLGFGVGHSEGRQLDIWQVVEGIDSKRSQNHPGVAGGLGVAGEVVADIQEVARVEARPAPGAVRGMRAQGLGRRVGGNFSLCV